MERLTSRELRISGLPGVCCTHFAGPECQTLGGCCTEGCPWEDAAWERLADYEDTMPLERAQELAQSEKDGRLVVLPCKVGDFVYALWDVPTEYKYVIYCAEIKEICMSVRNCRLTITYRLEPIEYRGRRKEYRSEDFGKTVFLTREEAEAALKNREADNEESNSNRL